MNVPINAKRLRSSLPEVVKRVQRGARYTVIYRSRPAFQIVPMDDSQRPPAPLEADPLYGAAALGRSDDGRAAAEHDELLYAR